MKYLLICLAFCFLICSCSKKAKESIYAPTQQISDGSENLPHNDHPLYSSRYNEGPRGWPDFCK
jgi:hypothetical protein